MRTSRSFVAAAAASLLLHLPLPAAAQQGQDYFIPGQAKPPAGAPRPQAAPRPPPRPAAPAGELAPGGSLGMAPGPAEMTEPPPPPQASDLPPAPEVPALPKGEAPPGPVMGVLGVPEVMHISSAAQQVEKVIGERRKKLDEDAQKEQSTWRDLQQALVNDRAKLSPEQIRNRERELQERITTAQRTFRERNRVIQEAAQYSLAQIERTLVAVIRTVAEARGMNLVLHRSQVALNVNQFDITNQVAEQLNKVLPTVLIPPDGVSPAAMAAQLKKEAATKAATAAPPAPPAAPAPAAAPPAASPKPAAPAK